MIKRLRVRVPAGVVREFWVSFQCLLLFCDPFHLLSVTAVASKRSQSFCQKCRWQVTAKDTRFSENWQVGWFSLFTEFTQDQERGVAQWTEWLHAPFDAAVGCLPRSYFLRGLESRSVQQVSATPKYPVTVLLQ